MKPNNSALPIYQGACFCGDCWALPGETHELSCSEVSLEEMRAEFDRLREEHTLWERRDRRMAAVGRVLLAAVLLLVLALLLEVGL